MNQQHLQDQISGLRSDCFVLIDELLRAGVGTRAGGDLAVAHLQDAANRLGDAELAVGCGGPRTAEGAALARG